MVLTLYSMATTNYKDLLSTAGWQYKRHNQEATDSVYRDFDSNSLDKSQPYVVNMFYKGSPAQERAYKEGKRSDWYTYWNTLIPGWSVGCYS